MADEPERSQDDPFESLFSLEEQYYQEGHALGVADGSQSGRIEGRVFGLERGFEKFAAMGALAGRCAVWEARLSHGPRLEEADRSKATSDDGSKGQGKDDNQSTILPIPENARLAKHLSTLYALVEAESLSTQNTEEAVSDFDDRLKRAEGKVKVIGKIIGEDTTPLSESEASSSQNGNPKPTNRNKDSNMEDFGMTRK